MIQKIDSLMLSHSSAPPPALFPPRSSFIFDSQIEINEVADGI